LLIHMANVRHNSSIFDSYTTFTYAGTQALIVAEMIGQTYWTEVGIYHAGNPAVNFLVVNQFGYSLTWLGDYTSFMAGPGVMVNNGTLNYGGYLDLYQDSVSTIINTGCWIYEGGEAFRINGGYLSGVPPAYTSTQVSAGLIVNTGAMTIMNGASIYYVGGTGAFYQCKTTGYMNFVFSPTTSYAESTFAVIALDGYNVISFANSSTYSTISSGITPSYISLFTWLYQAFTAAPGAMFNGTLTEVTNPITQGPLINCYSSLTGEAYVTTFGTSCQTVIGSSNTVGSPNTVTGGVCSGLPATLSLLVVTYPYGGATCGPTISTSTTTTTPVGTTSSPVGTSTTTTPVGTTSTPVGTSTTTTPVGTTSTPVGTSTTTPVGTTSTSTPTTTSAPTPTPTHTAGSTVSFTVVLFLLCASLLKLLN